MKIYLDTQRSGFGVRVIGDVLYAVGSEEESTTISSRRINMKWEGRNQGIPEEPGLVINWITSKLCEISALVDMSVAVVDGKIYLIGVRRFKAYVNVAVECDINTGSSKELANMEACRCSPGVVVMSE